MQYGQRPLIVEDHVGSADHRTLTQALTAQSFAKFEEVCTANLAVVSSWLCAVTDAAVDHVEEMTRRSRSPSATPNYERLATREYGQLADIASLCQDLGAMVLLDHYDEKVGEMAARVAEMGIDDVMRLPLQAGALGIGPNGARSIGDARMEQIDHDFYSMLNPHDGQVQAFNIMKYICRMTIYKEEWDLDHESICRRNGWNDPWLDKNAAILIWPRRHGKTTVAAAGELAIAMNCPRWQGAVISIQYDTACITINEMVMRATSCPRFLRDFGWRSSRGALTFWPKTDKTDLRISFALPQGVSGRDRKRERERERER